MFRRYRIATLLNLFGLSVAVATFYLFMTQVIYNRTYNHNINDYEQTYRLEIYGNLFGDNWGCTICRPFASMLKDVPQVNSVVYYCPYVNKTDVKVNNRTITVPVVNMSKPGIEFFTGKLISGSSKSWGTGATAILNRSTAEKMFGTANAAGKTFEINTDDGGMKPITVVGVSEDMPDNCTIPNGMYLCDNESGMTDWSEWSYYIYVRLDNGASPEKVVRGLKQGFMKANGISPKDEKEFDKQMKFRITSIDDVYFSGIGQQDKGNRSLVDVLTVASVFVLFIALLNLLNFSLSEVPMRMRGVNTRRVMGASVGSLRLKMIMESVLFAFVALVVGVLLVVAFQRSEACMKLVSGDIGFSAHWLLGGCCAGVLQHVVRSGSGAERIVRTLAARQTAAPGDNGGAVLRGFRARYIYRCNVEPVELYLQLRLRLQQERGVLHQTLGRGEGEARDDTHRTEEVAVCGERRLRAERHRHKRPVYGLGTWQR